MSDNGNKINDEVVMTESEKQEKILREQFKAKKRKKRIRIFKFRDVQNILSVNEWQQRMRVR